MKVTFCDIRGGFAGGDGIEAVHGSILDIACDAVVSPANSFGFMDGGVDYAYSAHFGWHVQASVMHAIEEMPFGELLVGQAIVVETGDGRIPHLISAPTMRVPKQIADAADVMLACRAATAAALRAGFSHIAFPGMGTGCGCVPFNVAEQAMKAGVRAALSPPTKPTSWRHAQDRHFRLEG